MVGGVYLPLWFAALLALSVLLVPFVDSLDRRVKRVALLLFGSYVVRAGRRRERRRQLLRSTHAATTYRVYAAKTLGYSAVFGVVGSIVGIYAIDLAFDALALPEAELRAVLPAALEFLAEGIALSRLTIGQLFVLLLVSSTLFGTLGGALTYYLRWYFPQNRARNRELLIDEGLARTVAFIFALSRSGMAYPDILRTVARNRGAYGEAAEELTVVVKHMDIFGTDLLSATERVAETTPSEEFADFAANLATVLRSGRRVSEYLHEEYEQYRREQENQQERLLELFSVLAEGYVAALVAGPLFLITILIIFGLILGGTLGILQLFVYLLVPMANVAFMAYLDGISTALTADQTQPKREFPEWALRVRRAAAPDVPKADGGAAAGHTGVDAGTSANAERLRAHVRFKRLRRQLRAPVRTAVDNPLAVLYVMAPLGGLWVLVRAWQLVAAGRADLGTLDDLVIQAGLVVVATFAVVQEVRSRRLREIEEVIPDFLDRLASTNEAGMTLVESIKRTERTDLGVLNEELDRVVSDMAWGTRAQSALYRMENRVGSTTVSRVVALITNAMNASGDISPVLRIAADEAQADRRLRRRRRQQLFTYVVVIYIAFLVFLGIVVALEVVFIPALPSAEEFARIGGSDTIPGTSFVSRVGQLTEADRAAYTEVLFHTTVVQAVFSGLVAGQMGEGSVRNGAKHVAILLALAYAVFLLV